jgi:hypothetical protein
VTGGGDRSSRAPDPSPIGYTSVMPGRISALRCLAALPLLAALLGQATDDHFEAALRQVQRLAHVQRDGSHLPRLAALRQLRDPAARPLLRHLAAHSDSYIQIHAMLGLAELADSGRFDPQLIGEIDERDQETLIAQLIDLELIGPEQIRALLSWEQLQAMPRVMLMGELMLAGEDIDDTSLERLARGGGLTNATALASLLLAQRGDGSAFSSFIDRLDGRPRRARDQQLLWIFEAIRQYRITAVAPWVERTLDRDDLDQRIARWGVLTALSLDATMEVRLWRRQLGADPSPADQIRYGMLLLATGASVPAETYDLLSSDNELVKQMASTGRTISRGADPTGELIALIDLGHRQSFSWAIDYTASLPDAQAARVYAHLIEQLETEDRDRAESVVHAIGAAARLYEIDPDAVLRRLERAEDDSLTQEALMLGILNAGPTETPAADPLPVVRRIDRVGVGRADSIALLLIARFAESLDDDQLHQLGMIAAGGGRVSEALQLEAAWLYLRHTDSTARALERIRDGVD